MIEVDTHIHSHFSHDSFQSPEKICKVASDRGLDGIAITDHNHFTPLTEFPDTGLIVINGMEIYTKNYGDLLALFIDEPIKSREFVKAVDEIHDQGGVAILPHPYRKQQQFPEKILNCVDAVEGINARSKEAWNERARALAEEFQLPTTGGSDAHTTLEIGNATTLVNATSKQEIIDEIKSGDVDYKGNESPYYAFHGMSVAMEKLKSRFGIKKVE